MPTRIFEALCYLAPNLNESCIRDRNDSIADVCRDAIACRGFRSSADDDQASGDSKDGHLYEAAMSADKTISYNAAAKACKDQINRQSGHLASGTLVTSDDLQK